MRVAKATKDDFDKTTSFLSSMEALFDTRNRYSLRNYEEDWKGWDDDDDDKKLILRCQKELSEEGGCDPDEVDNRLILFEFIKQKYQACDCSWNRVVWGASVLIDNACDPTLSHLDWHPFIDRALDQAYFGE